MLVAVIILTIIFEVLYHKIFHVVYFSGSAMPKEFTICAGLAVMVVCAVMNG